MGYVALVWEPIGEGERSNPQNMHDWGFGLYPSGHSMEGLMVWENMRALDYFCRRPEVDPKRIGVTGASRRRRHVSIPPRRYAHLCLVRRLRQCIRIWIALRAAATASATIFPGLFRLRR